MKIISCPCVCLRGFTSSGLGVRHHRLKPAGQRLQAAVLKRLDRPLGAAKLIRHFLDRHIAHKTHLDDLALIFSQVVECAIELLVLELRADTTFGALAHASPRFKRQMLAKPPKLMSIVMITRARAGDIVS